MRIENGKRDILIIMGRYLPGYKDGGPVRSIKNLTDYLGDEYNFKILTCDRDHGDEGPYPDIRVNDWNRVGKADVYYVSPGHFSNQTIIQLSKEADLLYVCGCMSDYSIRTLILNRFGKLDIPVVIAAMGLFSPKQFHIKYAKKKLFTTVFNITGMFQKIYWSATSPLEISEIKTEVWVTDDQFYIAEDLPRIVDPTPVEKSKEKGKLDIVWISRVSPQKNLLGAAQILSAVRSEVTFTIYGPIHDQKYWEKCLEELKTLPEHVHWEYKGNVESEQVVETLRRHQVFLFPTLGENYGHVIQEALSAGCPCIISDQTPWQDLEENGAGYVHSLEDESLFVSSIEEYAAMDNETFKGVIEMAMEYAIKNSNDKVKDTGYRNIFAIGLGGAECNLYYWLSCAYATTFVADRYEFTGMQERSCVG